MYDGVDVVAHNAFNSASCVAMFCLVRGQIFRNKNTLWFVFLADANASCFLVSFSCLFRATPYYTHEQGSVLVTSISHRTCGSLQNALRHCTACHFVCGPLSKTHIPKKAAALFICNSTQTQQHADDVRNEHSFGVRVVLPTMFMGPLSGILT